MLNICTHFLMYFGFFSLFFSLQCIFPWWFLNLNEFNLTTKRNGTMFCSYRKKETTCRSNKEKWQFVHRVINSTLWYESLLFLYTEYSTRNALLLSVFVFNHIARRCSKCSTLPSGYSMSLRSLFLRYQFFRYQLQPNGSLCPIDMMLDDFDNKLAQFVYRCPIFSSFISNAYALCLHLYSDDMNNDILQVRFQCDELPISGKVRYSKRIIEPISLNMYILFIRRKDTDTILFK